MRTSAVAGIVYANNNDQLLKKLTTNRSMASVPFGSRYRLIDFSLSNLVNAGIKTVGIITKENYRSLMDHVGSGVHWDLDRKNGGLFLLPPYSSKGAKRYNGTIDALVGASNYINNCGCDYIVICNVDILANVDISSVVDFHLEKGADISLVYSKGALPSNSGETMALKLNSDSRVKAIELDTEVGAVANYSIGITVIGKELLNKIVNDAHNNELVSFNRDVVSKSINRLKIYGYCHEGYVSVMNGTGAYYDANMDTLKPEVRSQLFNKERPIYTKTRDDMPTRYGTKSNVKNCLIGDGCVIDGTVKNSILFRGVIVEKGAVVENSILMQEAKICEGSCLDNVIADKNSVISKDMVLKGTCKKRFFVNKNEIV